MANVVLEGKTDAGMPHVRLSGVLALCAYALAATSWFATEARGEGLGVGESPGAGTFEVELPGEKGGPTALAPDPFPDRMSKFVWRNWFVVPHDRLAAVVGATEADLERLAVQMGLPREVDVLPKWHRKGYITVLRRNWHLLDYPQLLKLLEMTRGELSFALMEEDFLWIKLGTLKPVCGPLTWDASCLTDPAAVAVRRHFASILKEEGIDDFSEEPRFAFIDALKQVDPGVPARSVGRSPFDMRLIFSYFADYMDPLADPAVSSFPEGLLQKLAAQGVNAVWMHTVLSTLARDPKYPEFGAGSEDRMNNLRKLVARAAKYGIRVYLYMNEPRAQPPAFFAARPERAGMKGVTQGNEGTFTMCTSNPETLRWMRDAIHSVFKAVPGLGGIFTITMSENNTNCASRWLRHNCPRCRDRSVAEIVSEVNATLIEGMVAANPQAEALVWNWGWPTEDEKEILSRLPKKGCRVMAVSEGKMDINRGGVHVVTADYSLSVVGPGNPARAFWTDARSLGLEKTAAKVQANTTWEIATVPYLPVMDLVAEHASNLVRTGVDGVMLSWSLGCAPAPNLRVFDEIGKDGDANRTLDLLAADIYGASARAAVRKAWTSFSDGFRNYPFACSSVYNGPHHWGAVNPLYPKKTSFRSTMVGIPYDDVANWCAPYPAKTWADLMQKVADGFEKGCADWKEVIAAIGDGKRRELARREYGLFRTAGLHFASCVDQVRFVLARDQGDAKRMRELAARELARAREELGYVRADSRLGYESSCQYFFIPQDIREKIVGCRLIMEAR